MTDGSTPEQNSGISRRAALKRIGAAVGVAAGLGALGKKELPVGQEGLETKEAIFYPLYERHDVGIRVRDLPPHLDGFFREGTYDVTLQPRQDTIDVVRLLGTVLPESHKSQPLFQPDVLEVLAKQQTRIIMGDIELGEEIHQLRDKTRLLRSIAAAALIVAPFYRLVHKAVEKALEDLTGFKAEPVSTRRSFLKTGLLVAGALIGGPLVAEVPAKILMGLNSNFDQKNAIKRIATRLNGMVSHLRPEDSVVFFRSLVWADKLMTVAEDFSKRLGRKAEIGFNVGGGHAGIEDFLLGGHDFVRWLIMQYPKVFLQSVIDTNGSMESLCRARLLTLSPDFTVEQLQVAEGQLETYQKTIYEEIIDQPLLELLREKFAVEEEQDKKRRVDEIGRLKELFAKHVNGSKSEEFSHFIDSLFLLPIDEYRKKVRATESSDNTGTSAAYEIKLTKDSRLVDMAFDLQTKNGNPSYERISFFLDKNGNLTKNTGRADVVVIPHERLQEVANAIFSQSPENEKAWEYTPSGTGGTPQVGQAYRRSIYLLGDSHKRQYQISQDGRLEVIVWHE